MLFQSIYSLIQSNNTSETTKFDFTTRYNKIFKAETQKARPMNTNIKSKFSKFIKIAIDRHTLVLVQSTAIVAGLVLATAGFLNATDFTIQYGRIQPNHSISQSDNISTEKNIDGVFAGTLRMHLSNIIQKETSENIDVSFDIRYAENGSRDYLQSNNPDIRTYTPTKNKDSKEITQPTKTQVFAYQGMFSPRGSFFEYTEQLNNITVNVQSADIYRVRKNKSGTEKFRTGFGTKFIGLNTIPVVATKAINDSLTTQNLDSIGQTITPNLTKKIQEAVNSSLGSETVIISNLTIKNNSLSNQTTNQVEQQNTKAHTIQQIQQIRESSLQPEHVRQANNKI